MTLPLPTFGPMAGRVTIGNVVHRIVMTLFCNSNSEETDASEDALQTT
ncbi:MAG: hypothetical protein F6K30_15670 [Cyanothece sp. SIO2G6]|nr:hypothetical protein [Cyanothece sp. SIO2G6]